MNLVIKKINYSPQSLAVLIAQIAATINVALLVNFDTLSIFLKKTCPLKRKKKEGKKNN